MTEDAQPREAQAIVLERAPVPDGSVDGQVAEHDVTFTLRLRALRGSGVVTESAKGLRRGGRNRDAEESRWERGPENGGPNHQSRVGHGAECNVNSSRCDCRSHDQDRSATGGLRNIRRGLRLLCRAQLTGLGTASTT